MFHSPKTEDELVNWMAGISQAAPNLPILYYHIPKMTHVDSKFLFFILHACDFESRKRGNQAKNLNSNVEWILQTIDPTTVAIGQVAQLGPH